MAKKTIGKAAVPLSKVVIANGFAFVSGTVPVKPDGSIPEGIEAQTRLVLDQMKDLVAQAGGTMADVVKTTVFITDKSLFSGMNAVYGEFFADEPPARSTIVCDLVADILVEIEAVVAL